MSSLPDPNKDEVLNIYSNRSEYVPRRAPRGKLFYIVHPNPEVANRKYLYRLKRNLGARTSQPVFAPFRDGCLAFDNFDLACAYCEFVRNICPESKGQFYVALEAGARKARSW